ncbi:3919_t:CDS:2 [Diversispora eburnea]|uniref:3919_t:CDS:1 n=1 Tax=Diversispora eburnea TaxID=1213867 RepID=A0A9N9AUF6_9GLOM|nr:3919_t:CDS:2 [Diversispora eburnea]
MTSSSSTNNTTEWLQFEDSSSSSSDADQDFLLHYTYKFVLGGNYIAPINKDNLKTCLDINFGSGSWMMEMATEFPETMFYGIDHDPRTPDLVYPPNCIFQQGQGDFLIWRQIREARAIGFGDALVTQIEDIFREKAEIQINNCYVPIGKWAGFAGEFFFSALKLFALETASLTSERLNLRTEDDYKNFVEKIEEECEQYKPSINIYVGYAQKL